MSATRFVILLCLSATAGCNPIGRIREIERGGKMFDQRAKDIHEAVRATDNQLPPESDEQ